MEDWRDLRDLRDFRDLRDLRDLRHLRDLRDLRDLRKPRDLMALRNRGAGGWNEAEKDNDVSVCIPAIRGVMNWGRTLSFVVRSKRVVI